MTAAFAVLPLLAIHPGGHWYMWFFFPFFWIFAIFLCFALFRLFAFRFAGPPPWWRGRHWEREDGAEAILRARFAKGEIDEAEYRRLRDVLRDVLRD